MAKTILLIMLLSLAMSKDIHLDYGVDKKFSKSDNSFEFTYTGEKDELLVYIEYTGYDLEYQHSINSMDRRMSTVNTPGDAFFISLFYEEEKHQIKFDFSEARGKSEGKIWINPLKNKLPVDLSKKYYKNFFLLDECWEEKAISPLTYSITNAAKTVKFKFQYEGTIKADEGTFQVSNPFQVCEGENCQNDVTFYEFQQGKSYTIKINIQKVTDTERETTYYAIPKFSFGDENSSRLFKFSLWIFAFIFLLF